MTMKKDFIDVLRYHYFDFKGKTDRKSFWKFWVYAVPCMNFITNHLDKQGFGTLALILGIAIAIPLLAIRTRRLRDSGAPKLLYGLIFSPTLFGIALVLRAFEFMILFGICCIVLFIFEVMPSKRSKNSLKNIGKETKDSIAVSKLKPNKIISIINKYYLDILNNPNLAKSENIKYRDRMIFELKPFLYVCADYAILKKSGDREAFFHHFQCGQIWTLQKETSLT